MKNKTASNILSLLTGHICWKMKQNGSFVKKGLPTLALQQMESICCVFWSLRNRKQIVFTVWYVCDSEDL